MAQSAQEFQVKASFLYNLTQFTNWPKEAFASPESPLIIGLYGENPFDSFLGELIIGEQSRGRPLMVRHFSNIRDVASCHILYIRGIPALKEKEILDWCGQYHILTVGESNHFIRHGGMIRFINVENKIKFQINATAAKRSPLRISSKVLRLSEMVDENSDEW